MTRIALVTGGTSGLGSAICQQFAQDGYTVVANYLTGLEKQAEQWQKMMSGLGYTCDLIAADVSDTNACDAMAATLINKYKRIDVLVNNAGITRDATLKKLSATDWHDVINTNLNSVYNVTRPFISTMQASGFGRIVNISSINAQRGQFGQTNYSAAKAGVHGFSKALAQELAGDGITVNTVSPGFIDTDMVKAIPDEYRQQIIASIPVGRVGEPEDIARAVRFLVDDNSGYITGTELSVNGGLFMH